jgi:hypothetical protein
MAEDPEALAQISRLLGDSSLRAADAEEVRRAVEGGMQRLVEGLYAEAAASDDVIDRESALAFLDDRLRFLGPLLSEDQRTRAWDALLAMIETW